MNPKILFCVYFLTSLAISGDVPRIMVENVDSLATLKAPLDLCMQTNDFKKFEAKKQTQFIGLGLKIDGTVLKIRKFYDDKIIFVAYLQMVSKYSESQSAKELVNRYGQLCSDKMFFEIENVFAEFDSKINRYLR